jgi:hypothetical protein
MGVDDLRSIGTNWAPPDLGKKSLPSPFLPVIQNRTTIWLNNFLAGERKEREMRDNQDLTAPHTCLRYAGESWAP